MSEKWVGRSALILGLAAALWGSGVIPAIIPASVPAANKLGNGSKFQLATTGFTPTAGNCATWDSSANLADSGISTCGGAGTTVNSFNGRTGAVLPAVNDYAFSDISGTISTAQVGSAANRISQGAFASLPGSATASGDTFLATDSAYFFTWNGSAWNARYGAYPAVVPPSVGSLTFTNQGTSSASSTAGFIAFTAPGTASALNVLEKTKPAGAWTFTVAAEFVVNITQSYEIGIVIRDSSGGRAVFYGNSSSGSSNQAGLDTWTTVTNHNGGAPTGFTATGFVPRFVQLVNNGSNNCALNVSADGQTFLPISNGNCDAWVPSGGDRVGIAVGSSSATASIARYATFFSWSGV